MRIVVLTGMSGSGKTNALRALEDSGYYAIDNLPVPLIERVVALFSGPEGRIERLALVVDARTIGQGALDGSGDLEYVPASLQRFRDAGHEVDLVFLDASDDILVRRYSETRRRHPLGADGSVRDGILTERRLLADLRASATLALETSEMSVHDLRREVQHRLGSRGDDDAPNLRVTAMSFGFKHGIPTEADLVFDVRFLPNPHFVPELRPKTGQDEDVAEFVLERPETQGFLERLHGLLEFLLPQYEREGKAYLTIAFGCTGGRHRSVALAIQLAEWLGERGFPGRVMHRDVGR